MKSKYYISVVVFAVGLAISLFYIRIEERKLEKQLKRGFDSLIHKSIDGAYSLLNSSVNSVGRIARRWEANKGTKKKNWVQDSQYYINDQSFLKSIYWIDASYNIQWSVPKKAPRYNFLSNQESLSIFKRVERTKVSQSLKVSDPKGDMKLALKIFPIFFEGKNQGFIASSIDPRTFLERSFAKDFFNYQIIEDSQASIDLAQSKYALKVNFKIQNTNWMIRFSPSERYFEDHKEEFAKFKLLFGALISFLFSLLTYLLLSIKEKEDRLTQMNSTLFNQKKSLTSAIKTKSRFLATMSHEIRTPLNGVLSCANLLSDHVTGKEGLELLKTIQICGDSLLTVINDILDFSKIEAGKMGLEIRPYNLGQSVKEITSLLSPKASETGSRISYEIDKSTPNHINSDSTKFRQILMNLVGNAIKFTKSEIEIKVTAEKKETELKHRIFVSVRDNGIGVPDDLKQGLFASFSQVDASTTRKFGGTGLGLAICKGLVNSMNGEIWVESQEGVGSTFFFYFEAEECAQEDIPSEKVLASNDSFLSKKYPLNILLAEDNLINQMVTKKLLKKLGYEITMVKNGLEVVEALEKQQFDLILMDQHMPEMDGIEATEVICSKWSEEERPRIVALTASVMEEDKLRCLEAGMQGFLNKPMRTEEVIAEFQTCYDQIEEARKKAS